ncbi:MAG: T9SS type A sorting domain-containing protein [Bacteroidales bacterium]|nr:T9SS type A sorting domain-containing protein [Bacteroidales bacterium]
MKKLLLFVLMLGITISGFTQNRATVSKELRDYSIRKARYVRPPSEFSKSPTIPSYKADFIPEEEIIGNTFYDLQSNTSNQNRFHVYPDGTMAGVWTFGLDFPNFAGDRGTGYNYYDGSTWGPYPTERIESLRTGWPSYAPYGENGELVVSHDFGAGTLIVLTRDQKGTGTWSEDVFEGPAATPISWNRSTTSGINNSVIQTLCITWPEANNGSIYQGLDGALLYSRSADGGATWDPEHEILDGISSNEYVGFSADMYEWAATDDDNIAFLVGDSWRDFVLMKSDDGGDTWDKTVIWENPYPMFNPAQPTPTDTFYCVDGSHHLAYDSDGMIHVVFGINRSYSDGTGSFWFPGVGGIGYWNENRPTFSNDMDALCPLYDNCSYSELVEDYSLIGWTQDINNNGTIDVLDDWGTYYLGFSSMPQITINDQDNIYIVFTSVTETYDNGTQSYRHMWSRFSGYGDFWGPFTDLTSDLVHIFDECVFPSIASTSDDYYYLIYQTDTEPGLAVRGDEDPYGEILIRFMKADILEVWVGDEDNTTIFDYDVLQNYPNPFTGTSTVKVNVRHTSPLTLEVVNMMGQMVYSVDAGIAQPGMNKITIDGTKLTPGIYFYTVKAGEAEITKKMIVE